MTLQNFQTACLRSAYDRPVPIINFGGAGIDLQTFEDESDSHLKAKFNGMNFILKYPDFQSSTQLHAKVWDHNQSITDSDLDDAVERFKRIKYGTYYANFIRIDGRTQAGFDLNDNAQWAVIKASWEAVARMIVEVNAAVNIPAPGVFTSFGNAIRGIIFDMEPYEGTMWQHDTFPSALTFANAKAKYRERGQDLAEALKAIMPDMHLICNKGLQKAQENIADSDHDTTTKYGMLAPFIMGLLDGLSSSEPNFKVITLSERNYDAFTETNISYWKTNSTYGWENFDISGSEAHSSQLASHHSWMNMSWLNERARSNISGSTTKSNQVAFPASTNLFELGDTVYIECLEHPRGVHRNITAIGDTITFDGDPISIPTLGFVGRKSPTNFAEIIDWGRKYYDGPYTAVYQNGRQYCSLLSSTPIVPQEYINVINRKST